MRLRAGPSRAGFFRARLAGPLVAILPAARQSPAPGSTNKYRERRLFERDWSKYNGSRVTFRPQGMSIEQLEAGFEWIYQHFYSWHSIVKRTARRLEPIIWLINGIYHKRVHNWVAEMQH